MARTKMAPGEHSPIQAEPYARINGRRQRVQNARSATIWRGRSKLRARDGEMIDITRWARTKSGAVGKVEAALADLKVGDSALRPSMSFVAAGQFWLEQIKRPEAGKAEKTLEAYRGAWKRYLDADGSPFRALTLAQANDVQVILGHLQDVADNHGSGAAKMAKTVLSSIFGMAVRRGVLPINAARQAGVAKAAPPQTPARDHRRSFTEEERQRVLDAALERVKTARQGGDPRTVRKWALVADLLSFLAGTGVRISEARLLRWDDVDLQIDAKGAKGPGLRTHATAIIRGTKTDSSLRSVTLPHWLRKVMIRRQRAAGSAALRDGYVFASPALGQGDSRKSGSTTVPGTKPVDPSNLQDWVRQVLDDAEVPWATSHTFRRTVATRLHEGGAPLVRIADQLGHANPTMTANVYLGRDLRGDKADLAEML